MRISLKSKVLLLVATILVAETFFIWSISSLQSQAEQEAVRALKAQRVSDSLSSLMQKSFELYAILEDAQIEQFDSYVSSHMGKLDAVVENVNELKKLVKDDPKNYRIVLRSSKGIKRAIEIIHELQDHSGRKYWTREYNLKRRKLWIQLQTEFRIGMNDDLLSMRRAQKAVTEKSPERLADYREQMKLQLYIGFGANVFLSLMLALFLVRTITDRIYIMRENAMKLASDKPLHPVLKGDDEIAELDQVFHKMANSLKESVRKERSVFDNASDVICSIDNQGKISAINFACLNVLGHEAEELLGSYFIDLVLNDDASTALDTIEEIKIRGIEEHLRFD